MGGVAVCRSEATQWSVGVGVSSACGASWHETQHRCSLFSGSTHTDLLLGELEGGIHMMRERKGPRRAWVVRAKKMGKSKIRTQPCWVWVRDQRRCWHRLKGDGRVQVWERLLCACRLNRVATTPSAAAEVKIKPKFILAAQSHFIGFAVDDLTGGVLSPSVATSRCSCERSSSESAPGSVALSATAG